MSPLEGCGLRWDAAGCCSVGRCGYLQGRGRGARRHVVTICSRAAPPDAPRCQQHETAPVIAAAIAVRARAPSAVAAAAGRRPPGRLPCNHPIHHRLNQDQYLPSRSEHCRRTHCRSRRRSCLATIGILISCEMCVSLTPPIPRSPFRWIATDIIFQNRFEKIKMGSFPFLAIRPLNPRGIPIPLEQTESVLQFLAIQRTKTSALVSSTD